MKKEISFFIHFMTAVIPLTGCSSLPTEEHVSISPASFSEIPFADLFVPPQKEDKYWVYFYSPTCKACATATEILTKRWNQHPFPLYTVNIHENEISHALKDVTNIGVTDINSFYLYATPYSCLIENGCIVKEDKRVPEIQAENQWLYFE